MLCVALGSSIRLTNTEPHDESDDAREDNDNNEADNVDTLTRAGH